MVDGSYASISCSGTSRLITVNPKPTTTTPAPTTTTTRKPTQTTTTKAPTTTKDKKTTTSKDKTTTKNNEPSKDVNLKNIAINNNNLNFDPQKDTYDIEVSNDVEKADIKVELSDNKASLKIDGNTNLKIGSNIIKIIVTAEDNSVTKTYTLNIIRKDKNAVLSNNTYIRKLKINGYKLNFNKNTKSYELTIGNEKKLDIMVITEDSLSSYKIIGNDKLKDKNIIKIVVTAENGEIDTYSITINKEKNYNYLLYIIIAILVIINIILTILLIKKNKKQDNDTQNLNTTIQDVQIPEEVVKEENQILEETEISKSIDNFEEQEMLEIEDLNDEIDKAFDDTFNDEMNSND